MDLFAVPLKHKEVRTVIIVACDTDFVPIFHELQSQGIEIILYYYNDFIRKSQFSMSNEILTSCDRKILLTGDLLRRCRLDN